jgi:transcription-repair coupling factor (superfamily II helicase)
MSLAKTPAWYAAPGRLDLHGVPDGYEALVLRRAAEAIGEQGRAVLHIARDDARVAQLIESLNFFAPNLSVLSFPAWDCLPYDRVSPNSDVVAKRLDTLTRLLAEAGRKQPKILLTTVAAITQRVPTRESLAQAALVLKAGQRIEGKVLLGFFERNGYHRTETVREPGEYAVRGGIIDVFPTGMVEPLRLDFFGDMLETLRDFDPASQRSTGTRKEVTFRPVSEVPMDEIAIHRFRSGYRSLFGAETSGDPLYEAVSAGRKQIGMEHWLPLFHERLETLFDYLPTAAITLDPQAEESIQSRFDQIREFFQARKDLANSARKEGAPYHPLPADLLYLTDRDFRLSLEARPHAVFHIGAAPEDAANRADTGTRPGHEFAEARMRPDGSLFDTVREHVVSLRAQKRRVIVAAQSPGARDRLFGLMRDHGMPALETADSGPAAFALPADKVVLVTLAQPRGFLAPDFALITEADILGDRLIRTQKRKKAADFITDAGTLGTGDLVVHVDHGIGRYEGLETITAGGAPHDCLCISYLGGDKLYVPAENIDTLSRFGSEDAGATLDKLGGAAWQARKAKVKARIRDIAAKLIAIAAQRALREGAVLTPAEGLYDEFCARFPYAETDDQLRAIEDTISDLAAGKPMDRLICGDVGFGKTEVALRAAFVAALSGEQVAVVVPTTLLARQHYHNFSNRFKGFPVRVETLSRLVPPKQAALTKAGVKDGTVDIIVGTHAVLAKSIEFKRLGLLIVDEEQHFGVSQKERLKELKSDVHVLTLTATPIPRTLQLALTGVRDLSIIATPPVDRLAVRTAVLPYDPMVVREAILREHFRGGQSFYVSPRLEDLDMLAERLRALVPEVTFTTAHGRMAATQLEDVMNAFCDGKYDVLLSTNIVESGLDIPSANTMIVHRADLFGLSQLYQLRGRIGRSKLRAYAYLTLPVGKAPTDSAQKRLEVMQTLDKLGAGFQLASHDLDIRGAGNLLGDEQSGHIREVGIELYQHMLQEAVDAARAGGFAGEGGPDEAWSPQIAVGIPVRIPETYVADLGVRLDLYRRAAVLADRSEIDGFAAEMIDRFGPLPPDADGFLKIIAIKSLCRQAGVEKIDAGPKGVVISFRNKSFKNPDALIRYLQKQAGTVKLRPDHKLVVIRAWDTTAERLQGVTQVMQQLADLVE